MSSTELFLKNVYARYMYLYKVDKFNKYSITLLIPKTNTELVDKIESAVSTLQKSANIKKMDNEVLVDGDTRETPISGYYLLTCGSNYAIKVIDNKRRVLNEDEGTRLFTSGCEVHALVNLKVYETGSKKGISKYPICVQYAGVGLGDTGLDDESIMSKFDTFDIESKVEEDPY